MPTLKLAAIMLMTSSIAQSLINATLLRIAAQMINHGLIASSNVMVMLIRNAHVMETGSVRPMACVFCQMMILMLIAAPHLLPINTCMIKPLVLATLLLAFHPINTALKAKIHSLVTFAVHHTKNAMENV